MLCCGSTVSRYLPNQPNSMKKWFFFFSIVLVSQIQKALPILLSVIWLFNMSNKTNTRTNKYVKYTDIDNTLQSKVSMTSSG